MVAPLPGPRPPGARERLRSRHRRALTGSAATVATLAAVGGFLGAPADVAAVRLFGVALGWWAALLAQAVALAVLALDGEEGGGPSPRVTRASGPPA